MHIAAYQRMKEGNLATLNAISENYDDSIVHVIFFHGLSGHFEKTWTISSSGSPILWPKWLEEDIPGVGLWLVGYPAAKTNWFSHSLPLSERADNILARLLAEPHLENGNIIFVVHSLGGLVVEKLLRNAERDSTSSRKVEGFLSRVKRVAFLGTPHQGSFLASIAKSLSLLRPSSATNDLALGSPQLRELNYWYRAYCRNNNIENLVLAEGRAEKILGISLPNIVGMVVSPNSADAGLPEIPTRVDESHISICKPTSRDNEVYVHLKEFISRPFGAPSQVTRTAEALDKNTLQLGKLTTDSQAQSEAIKELTRAIEDGIPATAVNAEIIDAEVTKQLSRLRRVRFFGVVDTTDEARKLITSLLRGSLVLASNSAKAEALAWCARFLAIPAPDEAEAALEAIVTPGYELSEIAHGLIISARGHLNDALGKLTVIGTPLGYGAAYISVLNTKGFEAAHNWLQESELSFLDLDSDAKFFYIRSALENGEWSTAFEAAKVLSHADLDRSPGLILAKADAYLSQAVPDELRMSVMQYLPFDAANFPLRSDPESIAHRRKAAELFEYMRGVADDLGIPSVAETADDQGLWLRLMDPDTATEARRDLATSLEDPGTLLQRLHLALQFGIEIDLLKVEKEVDRQTTLSGGTSHDAAVARFALAFTQKNRTEAAAYIDQHRDQLLQHLYWKGIYFFEIEMLASSGQISQAQVRLQEAISRGLTDSETNRLHRQLAEATGSDPITERLAIYEQSKSITDLRLLVDAYEEVENWEKAVEYGKSLLDETGDIADARRLAISLYNQERLDEVIHVFAAYPTLTARYTRLSLLHAQTLFELGTLEEARTALSTLRQTNDSADARQLQINLAITSGDWESLQGFVEDEWHARDERTSFELVRAGQIAQRIGAARGKDLVREAAKRAPEDPSILLSCYNAASMAGWENRPEVHQWLERATALSEQNENGPIQRVSIKDLLEQKPDWEKHETDIWGLLAKGDLPLFTAGRFLNQSLVNLFLFPALNNLSETDVRKRPVIYGFSGARGTNTADPQAIAMDATALMTAEFLGILTFYVETFDRIIVPHSTLGWLLEEKARILFHQPSRVADARNLRRMIADSQLQVLEESTPPPEALIQEVGVGLATLIAEASSKHHPDTRQRLVVRGRPVHKANTFMEEEADLTAYEPHLCSSTDVVEKLAQKGLLTQQEADEAHAALNIREKPWSSKPEIADGAILYLDDITVSHLEFLGLLTKLHRADITAVVAYSEIEEADALIKYDAIGEEVATIVERLRAHVREGLDSGKITLGRLIRGDHEDDPQGMKTHPTVAMLKLVNDADAGVVDDRFVNQHAQMASENISKPLLTTIDILDILERRGVLKANRKQEARTKLRQANFSLMPINQTELIGLLSNAPIQNGALIETAELRAVRENLLRVRMSEILQSPKDLVWLNEIQHAFLLALKNQWNESLDESVAVSRSDWLLSLGDVRGWSHRFHENAPQIIELYHNWLALLMMLPVAQPDFVKEAYWRWFESRILDPISEEDPEAYAFLIKQAKKQISQGIESTAKDLEDSSD
ncbi:HTH domain-containing protein [Chromohalobacter israelensis]|uniref:HTH domain-containing protein n=1 Tax=Chromohalobacter israelensis TaxID=141390 RepID=UPI0015C4CC2F|nr:hypothetical protein [Chromohalobacter salexigens]